MSDTSAAETLKRNGNDWEAVKVVYNIRILSGICPNNQCRLNFQGQNKGAPDANRGQSTHEIKTSPADAPSFSPQVSSLLVCPTLACSDDSRAHSYTSQAGDRMLVRSDLAK